MKSLTDQIKILRLHGLLNQQREKQAEGVSIGLHDLDGLHTERKGP